jgi:integrative and conjugative element protein (TIGR02256 family)
MLRISDRLLLRIGGYGKRKYPLEFGGLLIGRYLDGNTTVSVEDILVQENAMSSRFSFERSNTDATPELEKFFRQLPSLTYVGEWHTHPDNPAIPSRQDLASMQELAKDSRVLITNPILMILGISANRFQMQAYVLYDDKLLRYSPVKD